MVVGGAFAAPPDARMGLRFKTRQTTVRQRVVFGVQTTGLGFVAMGSLAIALSQQVEWWLILVTMLVALAALDVLVAWPLKRVWDERSEIASRVAATGEIDQTAAAQRQEEIGRRCATSTDRRG